MYLKNQKKKREEEDKSNTTQLTTQLYLHIYTKINLFTPITIKLFTHIYLQINLFTQLLFIQKIKIIYTKNEILIVNLQIIQNYFKRARKETTKLNEKPRKNYNAEKKIFTRLISNTNLKSIVNCFFTKPINFKLNFTTSHITSARIARKRRNRKEEPQTNTYLNSMIALLYILPINIKAFKFYSKKFLIILNLARVIKCRIKYRLSLIHI